MIRFRRFFAGAFGQLHRRDYSAGWRGWLMLCLDSLYQVVVFIAVGLFAVGGLTFVLALALNSDRSPPVSSDPLQRCIRHGDRAACDAYNESLTSSPLKK